MNAFQLHSHLKAILDHHCGFGQAIVVPTPILVRSSRLSLAS